MVEKVIRTARGLRFEQHGSVLSELLNQPGPTHSLFDVLAACIAALASGPRIGLLGFAAGGLMAPLRAMGCPTVIHAVDLQETGYRCFRDVSRQWGGDVCFTKADAVTWLEDQATPFDLLMEDLSVPVEGDVEKPRVSWEVLPALIRRRLRPGGVAVINVLPSAEFAWPEFLPRFLAAGETAQMVLLKRFQNRVLIHGRGGSSALQVSRELRAALSSIRSRQAGEISVRTVRGS